MLKLSKAACMQMTEEQMTFVLLVLMQLQVFNSLLFLHAHSSQFRTILVFCRTSKTSLAAALSETSFRSMHGILRREVPDVPTLAKYQSDQPHHR